ncbi:MAG: FeoA family protein [Syntrophomonadaceae bacterium]|nr:FeoA family protein [Syntrophomonadaceae bacterium]
MTISELLPGQKATIIKINKGEAARNRLLAMGIIPGTSITILARHPFRGPVTVDLGNNRIAIGQEIARAIEVKPQ